MPEQWPTNPDDDGNGAAGVFLDLNGVVGVFHAVLAEAVVVGLVVLLWWWL